MPQLLLQQCNVGVGGFLGWMFLHWRGFSSTHRLVYTGRYWHRQVSSQFPLHHALYMRSSQTDERKMVGEEDESMRGKKEGKGVASELQRWYSAEEREGEIRRCQKNEVIIFLKVKKKAWEWRRVRQHWWIWLPDVQQHIHVLNLFTVITGSTGSHCLCCSFGCILRRMEKAASAVLKSATLSAFCICGWQRRGKLYSHKLASSSGCSLSLRNCSKLVIFSPFPFIRGCQEFNL